MPPTSGGACGHYSNPHLKSGDAPAQHKRLEQRGPGEVGSNVHEALQTISENEEFINMTLAVLMTPE